MKDENSYKIVPLKANPQQRKPTILQSENSKSTSGKKVPKTSPKITVPKIPDSASVSKNIDSVGSVVKKQYETLQAISKPADGSTPMQKVLRAWVKKYRASRAKKIAEQKPVKVTEGKTDFSQNYIPIKEVKYGVIHLSDDRWVRISEIEPINFYEKNNSTKNYIIDNFTKIFAIYPGVLQIKSMADRANPIELIENVQKNASKDDPPGLIRQRQDYVDKIKRISNTTSVSKRFFIIYQYLGKSRVAEEIAESMNEMEQAIDSILSQYGNTIIHRTNDQTYNTMCILYSFFNRKSYHFETYDYRYQRMIADAARYNRATGEQKTVTDLDLISPRGINTSYRNCVLMDGQFYTWLMLKESGHPFKVYAGWVDNFSFGEDTDVDIHIKRLPYERTLGVADQYTSAKKFSARRKVGNQAKYEEMMGDVNNNLYVTRKMRNEKENLYDVSIIMTIRADSRKGLIRRRNQIVKDLKASRFDVEEAFLNTEAYFKMTMPLLFTDRMLMGRNKRNYLTSSLASLYNFTSPEIYDPTGAMMGINAKTSTIVAVNFFNTHRYSNANMSIFGTSGSGKTFTEQVLGYGMLMAGIRVIYILPVKGHEYLEGCRNVNGSYISLAPGSKPRINIMAIRPETQIDTRTLGDDAVVVQASLLAKKITAITTAIQLLMQRERMTMMEESLLNTTLVNLYRDFGITDDNGSIFDRNGDVKEMPVAGDLYDVLVKTEGLERITSAWRILVDGICSNMNGQTNVDLNNNYIVFNIDEEVIGETLLPFFMFVVFDCVYDMAKSSRTHFDMIFLDEIWKMLVNEYAAKQIMQIVKLIRGYAGGLVIATQDISDLVDNTYGSKIVSNSDLKLFLKLKENECGKVSELFNLGLEDQKTILGFQRGEGMLYASNDKAVLRIIPSEKEIMTFTTDPNILREKLESQDT